MPWRRAVSAGQLASEAVADASQRSGSVPIVFHQLGNTPRVGAMAQRLVRGSAYDAAYLVLAEELGFQRMDGPGPKHTAPDDGGLGQVLGALKAEKQTKELEAQARKRDEAIERNARIKAVEEAFVRQDATILNAVTTFLQKASHIAPAERIATRYEKRRRFVPFVIERYSEAVEWDGAHVIFKYHRSLGEDSSINQSVLVRTNGVVLFWSGWSRLGQKDDDSRQKTERPTDQPGILPFWVPKPNPNVIAPLGVIPYYHDELGKLSKEDVDRTIEWFVHALAAYLVHGTQTG